jgi:hypothetical protein
MWRRLLGGGLLLRTIVRELSGIRLQLTRQNDLAERALQIYAPEVLQTAPGVSRADLADTGYSHLDLIDAGLVEEYRAKTHRDTGRDPSEEEILIYLADEKTIDLQIRMKERAALAQLDRLGVGR